MIDVFQELLIDTIAFVQNCRNEIELITTHVLIYVARALLFILSAKLMHFKCH